MRKIKISSVNELAVHMVCADYFKRRDLILIWLKRQEISVYGKRSRDFKDDYDRLKKKMEKLWRKS